jgi:uncharacterized protein with PQ loop repeat
MLRGDIMESELIWIIGLLASIFITISFFPQVHKMWILRHTQLKEFHILWFAFSIVGSLLFVGYGVLINQIGLIILNSVGLIMAFLMFLIYKGAWLEK